MKQEEGFEICGGVREDLGMKTYLYGRTDHANRVKLRFRVEDVNLRERRKWYASKGEEEEDAQMCLRGETVE